MKWGIYMELTETQIIVVRELDFQSTMKEIIQHILQMLDTPKKVEQMKKYLLENHNKKLTQNQIILKANQIQNKKEIFAGSNSQKTSHENY